MEYNTIFTALAQEGLPLLDYSIQFRTLAPRAAFDDGSLKSLNWIGANFHQPLNLPDMMEGAWREAILRCLESVYPQSTPSPASSNPEPNQLSAQTMDTTPEPTADGELLPAAMNEPEPEMRTVPTIVPSRSPTVSLTRCVSQKHPCQWEY